MESPTLPSSTLGVYLTSNSVWPPRAGPIPPELGNINNLALLYLQRNQLTGEIFRRRFRVQKGGGCIHRIKRLFTYSLFTCS